MSGQTVAIQTKTTGVASKKFRLGKKDERIDRTGNEWYVLVSLQGLTARPDFFVLSRNLVAAICFLEHQAYLLRGGKENSGRGLRRRWIEPYRERWDLLQAPPSDAPNLLHPSFHDAIERFALPEGHPGLPPQPTGVDLGGPLPS